MLAPHHDVISRWLELTYFPVSSPDRWSPSGAGIQGQRRLRQHRICWHPHPDICRDEIVMLYSAARVKLVIYRRQNWLAGAGTRKEANNFTSKKFPTTAVLHHKIQIVLTLKTVIKRHNEWMVRSSQYFLFSKNTFDLVALDHFFFWQHWLVKKKGSIYWLCGVPANKMGLPFIANSLSVAFCRTRNTFPTSPRPSNLHFTKLNFGGVG